jgi:hypothetical protein
MIVQILENKGVSQDTSFLCNQYDNESSSIKINLPAIFVNQTYLYFLICKSPDKTVNQYSVPLLLTADEDLIFIVNSTLSSTKGYWQFCLVIKEASGNLVAVTNYWTGVVKSGIIAEDELAEQVEDSNLKLANEAMLEAEALRVIAEDTRKQNETDRLSAQQAWLIRYEEINNAENARNQNEIAREELKDYLLSIKADLEAKLETATENALEASENADRALGYANIATQQAVIAMQYSNDVTVLQKAPSLDNMDMSMVLQKPNLSLI